MNLLTDPAGVFSCGGVSLPRGGKAWVGENKIKEPTISYHTNTVKFYIVHCAIAMNISAVDF
jgi:hypothetical protein